VIRGILITVLVLGAIAAGNLEQGAVIAAQAPQAEPTSAVTLLVYRDQLLTDEASADLVGFIASVVPREKWTEKAILRAGESIESLIDRIFDYYSTGEYARPLTVQALRRELLAANPQLRQRPLAPVLVTLPPVPVRAKGRRDVQTPLRAFEATSNSYGGEVSPAVIALQSSSPRLVLSESADDFLASGSALTSSARRQLDQLVQELAMVGGVSELHVRGLAATTARGETGLATARQRASEVERYLQQQGPQATVSVASAAEAQPSLPPSGRSLTPIDRQGGVAINLVSETGARVQLAADAAQLPLQRDVSGTAIILDGVDAGSVAQMAATRALPAGVVAFTARRDSGGVIRRQGFARFESLENSNATACDQSVDWFASSPYAALARKRFADLDQAGRLRVRERIKQAPIVLFDFDFSGNGHGSKVDSVVRGTIASVTGNDQAFAPTIRHVDFVLREPDARKEAEDLVKAYGKAIDLSGTGLEADALKWIEEESAKTEWAGEDVSEFLVQALLWKHVQPGTFVNMSFRMRGVLRWQLPLVLNLKPNPFVSIAAGNTPTLQDPAWSPQDAVISAMNTVSVTFGLPDGRILGTFGGLNGPFKTVVSMAGPGCGFAIGTAKFTDSGSSLAAPYVLAGSWLRFVLDGSRGAVLRADLLQSVTPILEQTPGLDSPGLFDLARLLAAPLAHVRERGPTVRGLTQFTFEVHKTEHVAVQWTPVVPEAGKRKSIVIQKVGDSFIRWTRTVDQTTFEVSVVRDSVNGIKFTTTDGTYDLADLDKFVQVVLEVVM
jgi:outer membrane protein OmpA-like peptidoglycan-associated protein